MMQSLQQRAESKYKVLYQRIARAIQDGRFYRYTKQKQHQLLQRLQRYYQQLVRRGQWMVPAAGLIFGGASLSHAQIFTEITTTVSPFVNLEVNLDAPFGLTDVESFSTPSFVDIDGDGDLDAFVGEFDGNIIYFQNTGTSVSAAFSAPSTNPFGLTDVGSASAPSFVDIDKDGDFDAFVGERGGDILYFQNTGTSVSAAFSAPSTNPFGLTDVGPDSKPSFVDVDNDGDLDAFVGELSGNILYFQNTGDSISPSFNAPSTNPFGLSDVGGYSAPSFVDIDNDGDFDAFVGKEHDDIFYFQNMGTTASPAFSAPSTNPFGLSNLSNLSTPSFVDIDNDGDFDAFVGESSGNILYFQNTGTSTSAAFLEPVVDVGRLAAPSFVDIDNDGDFDAFVGERGGSIIYSQNTGVNSDAAFNAPNANPFGLSDVGLVSTPSFVDIDNDGDFDAFAGDFFGNIFYFQNIGTSVSAAFASPSTNPFGLSNVGSFATPTFLDIDGDRDLDAFVGEQDGNIFYFQNTGTTVNAAFSARIINPFGLSDVGSYSAPSFVDIDNDGDLDAFVGEQLGNIFYFQNTGTIASAAFSSTIANPFGLNNVGSDSKPSFVDIDGDGFFEAIIGNDEGRLIFFENNSFVVAINDELRKEALAVFPNPVQESLTIVNGQGMATLYNALGQVVQQFQIANAQFQIEVSGLQHGVYTLQVRRADGMVLVQQVVK